MERVASAVDIERFLADVLPPEQEGWADVAVGVITTADGYEVYLSSDERDYRVGFGVRQADLDTYLQIDASMKAARDAMARAAKP